MSLFLFGNFNYSTYQSNDQIGGYDYETTFNALKTYIIGKPCILMKQTTKGKPDFLKITFDNNNFELFIYQNRDINKFATTITYIARGKTELPNIDVQTNKFQDATLNDIKYKINILSLINTKATKSTSAIQSPIKVERSIQSPIKVEPVTVEPIKVQSVTQTLAKLPVQSQIQSEGSAIIVFYRENKKYYILNAKESTFLSDIKDSIKKTQTDFTFPQETYRGDFVSAEQFFKSSTETLNTMLSSTYGKIKYDQIVPNGDGTEYSVHYRYHGSGRKGIPKGGSNTGEEPERTARRELKEECGDIFETLGTLTKIDEPNESNNYTVFALELKGDEIETAKAAIEEKNSLIKGELYDIKFDQLDTITTSEFDQFNKKSICSLYSFTKWLTIDIPNISNDINKRKCIKQFKKKDSSSGYKKYELKGGYYQKYLKYKLKYLKLKKQLNM